MAAIRRPLAKSRANDPAKVAWLMESIAEVRVLRGVTREQGHY